MNLFRKSNIVLSVSVIAFQAHAYHPDTHEELSRKAVRESVLMTEEVAKAFGWAAVSVDPPEEFASEVGMIKFPSFYQGLPSWPRGEEKEMLSIVELVAFGSSNEDEEALPRPLTHFYNPLTQTPLSLVDVISHTSPDWALEDRGDLDIGLDARFLPGLWRPIYEYYKEPLYSEQVYSVKELKQYLYSALTSNSSEEESRYWGITFQSLGHVIHHIQDMAQPEHVRDDPHLDVYLPGGIMYDPSYYEEYSNYITVSLSEEEKDIETLYADDFLPSSLTRFDTSRGFWDTGDGGGLSNFTNKNFVSKDTNFQIENGIASSNADFPNPVPIAVTSMSMSDPRVYGDEGAAMCSQAIATLNENNNTSISIPLTASCYMQFWKVNMFDPDTGQQKVNDFASTYSIFDQYVEKFNVSTNDDSISLDGVFTLNTVNFKHARSYLFPRAVEYAKGLINSIFKKRIEIEQVPNENAVYVRNISGKTLEGKFQLFAKGGKNYIEDPIYPDYLDTLPNSSWSTSVLVIPDGLYPELYRVKGFNPGVPVATVTPGDWDESASVTTALSPRGQIKLSNSFYESIQYKVVFDGTEGSTDERVVAADTLVPSIIVADGGQVDSGRLQYCVNSVTEYCVTHDIGFTTIEPRPLITKNSRTYYAANTLGSWGELFSAQNFISFAGGGSLYLPDLGSVGYQEYLSNGAIERSVVTEAYVPYQCPGGVENMNQTWQQTYMHFREAQNGYGETAFVPTLGLGVVYQLKNRGFPALQYVINGGTVPHPNPHPGYYWFDYNNYPRVGYSYPVE